MRRTQIKKKAKAKSSGWWQKRADSLMQDLNRKKFVNCLVCAGKNEVGHHFITKSLSSYLRYDFRNLIPLCHRCHFNHHIKSDPAISATIEHIMGLEWYRLIESVRRNTIKTGVKYYQDICNEFEKQLTEMS